MKYIVLIISLFLSVSFAAERYAFQSERQQQEFIYLTKSLRCLVCQNETLYDSQATLALELRSEIYQMVIHGQDSQKIKIYMVQRYGNFVLFDPPFIPQTYLLWFGPFLILIIGLIIWGIVLKQHRAKEN